ncbi:MAG TPA: NUDIX hydrolase [Phycisphaerae bacterium]|nr:NUDIX hydrolase [Phycisphaerae bacterium]HNU43875.1 NUDIX hydrolase [Phycisphaerae bacterium]
MPVNTRFCAQCGGPVTTQEVGDRPRDVCSVCGTVFYRNPLPVAAAVVLNDRREVLLVKRRQEPHRGMWCLPIGFAELGETIAQAAGRELKEEAGIDGQVVRLLDTDSHYSDHYGDLLIVTFEMTKLGGLERPGDDAEAVAYFPLDAHPPLAFSSNDKALACCVRVHQDEWAIQDSFQQLETPSAQALLSDALVTLIRDQAAEVTRAWLADVRSNPSTPSYPGLDAAVLHDRGFTALSQFGRWLRGNEAEDEVRAFYRALGVERRADGIAFHEVVSSLSLLRKHVWLHACRRDVWSTLLDVYRVLELNRRIALFFDKALYDAARGYESCPPPDASPHPS